MKRNEEVQPFLPLVVIRNVRSWTDKRDELKTRTQYLEGSIMRFTETCLQEPFLDSLPDYRSRQRGKHKGGGIVIWDMLLKRTISASQIKTNLGFFYEENSPITH